MNERIQQLAEQAGSTHKQNLGVYQFYTDELEKFAELIVQECSKVIRNNGQRKGAFGNEDLRPHEIATMIKEHFGVDE